MSGEGRPTTPVPGTGRHGSYRQFRAPRCANVLRRLVGIVGNLRGEKVPPDAWDDIQRAASRDRTWKRHRRTRWKVTR